ncbi:Glycosyl hydrolase family 67 C-terminal [Penicillium canariense]|uniref:Alpha-glucuronidase n=1 Tax=Penicillium canariense TaxID=189055 RepID=A0A9W9IGA2_9EURO|nr:Glycosyl hydrolase family 67 C-terminal [Penicillium canariense]KAJ5177024.1 Glycosyl hydrolase family 67 C-terminal [Penicillium canariense]
MRALFFLASLGFAAAEDGLDGWLRYASLPCSGQCQSKLPANIVVFNATETSPVYVAGSERQAGIQSIYGIQPHISHNQCKSSSSAIVVGTVHQYRKTCGSRDVPELEEDGFWLSTEANRIYILGQMNVGNFSEVSYSTNPSAPIRWVNQWDNIDGRIERGYGGPSIFFKDGAIISDLTRVRQYARLLSSIRINAVVVNNLNANATLLTPANLKGLGRIADTFRPYGVQVGISLNFASPEDLGGLSTFDPLDSSVISWWSNITKHVYQHVPDMAGYLVKADSEGQPGPQTYSRTLSQGANLFGKALQPYGGIVMFRAFVYNQLNESVWTADRANAAVNFFKDLDGEFDENVVVQIKYGPIDFQVREPASPLFANLFNTSTAIELEVTQEYLGQQSHLLYLPPLWKTILDFDLRVDGKPSLVRDVVTGKRFNRKLGGSAAVVNVGTNTTWLGSHLSMSNLYAYGRLAWNPADDAQAMLQDWIRLTFGLDRTVLSTITKMSMDSWPAYEAYSGNLGIQTLTDILYTHYGPNPASQDNNGWGQWTRADHTGIGMDRTVSKGTGFAGQYPSEIAAMYENIDTTPDNLLLWFHHVEYMHSLHSGKSVIQHFYDAHYSGAETVQTFLSQWESLKGKIDDERYEHVLRRLEYQAGHSIVWRDAINNFYYNLSGIPDTAKRVGHHPWRIEAESMQLEGYKAYTINPFETASGSVAIVTAANDTMGTATTQIKFPSGTYDLAVNHYDIDGGQSHWQAYLNDKQIVPGVKVNKGDALKIVGKPDGVEPAPLDYVAFLPDGVVD